MWSHRTVLVRSRPSNCASTHLKGVLLSSAWSVTLRAGMMNEGMPFACIREEVVVSRPCAHHPGVWIVVRPNVNDVPYIIGATAVSIGDGHVERCRHSPARVGTVSESFWGSEGRYRPSIRVARA